MNQNQNQNQDLRTQRFPSKAEAERCRKQLVISGYNAHIYKGHRAYVLQWWEPPPPTADAPIHRHPAAMGTTDDAS